jgi:hypothetical protein
MIVKMYPGEWCRLHTMFWLISRRNHLIQYKTAHKSWPLFENECFSKIDQRIWITSWFWNMSKMKYFKTDKKTLCLSCFQSGNWTRFISTFNDKIMYIPDCKE